MVLGQAYRGVPPGKKALHKLALTPFRQCIFQPKFIETPLGLTQQPMSSFSLFKKRPWGYGKCLCVGTDFIAKNISLCVNHHVTLRQAALVVAR